LDLSTGAFSAYFRWGIAVPAELAGGGSDSSSH
jgi:hypothetical protein